MVCFLLSLLILTQAANTVFRDGTSFDLLNYKASESFCSAAKNTPLQKELSSKYWFSDPDFDNICPLLSNSVPMTTINKALSTLPGPKDSYLAVRAYTGDYYKYINPLLRKPPVDTTWKYTTVCASNGIRNLPKSKNFLFRGVSEFSKYSSYYDQPYVTETAFTSTSLSLNVAAGFAINSGRDPAIFVISAFSPASVASFTCYDGEAEYLAPPGWPLKILAKEQNVALGSSPFRWTIFYVYEVSSKSNKTKQEENSLKRDMEAYFKSKQKQVVFSISPKLFHTRTPAELKLLANKYDKWNALNGNSPKINFHLLKQYYQRAHLFTVSNISLWECPLAYYNASDGCDCECGTWDPDCDIPTERTYGCYNGSSPICVAPYNCVYSNPPSGWSCPPEYYNSSDGCDCNCGVEDPDCLEDPNVSGCDLNQVCISGKCTNISGPPASWVCESSFYNASDDCDCNCGAPDPDCQPGVSISGCPCDAMKCQIGFCVGSCNGYSVHLSTNVASAASLSIGILFIALLHVVLNELKVIM